MILEDHGKSGLVRKAVLALHFGALGDFVISWPALRALKAGAGRLELVTRPEWGRLISRPQFVHDRDSARLAGLFSPEPEAALEAWLASFDLIVVFAARPPQSLLTRLRAAGVRQILVIDPRPLEGSPLSAWEHQLEAVAGEGFETALPPPRRAETKGAVVIAPGSGGRPKRLGPELVRGLVGGLNKHNLTVKILFGPAEDEAFRAHVLAAVRPWRIAVWADPGFGDLVAGLSSARVFVGADSGVSHLAAALGAAAAVVFGPSDPRIWAPRGATILTPDAPCAPCGPEAARDCEDRKCLHPSSARKILKTLERMIGL